MVMSLHISGGELGSSAVVGLCFGSIGADSLNDPGHHHYCGQYLSNHYHGAEAEECPDQKTTVVTLCGSGECRGYCCHRCCCCGSYGSQCGFHGVLLVLRYCLLVYAYSLDRAREGDR